MVVVSTSSVAANQTVGNCVAKRKKRAVENRTPMVPVCIVCELTPTKHCSVAKEIGSAFQAFRAES